MKRGRYFTPEGIYEMLPDVGEYWIDHTNCPPDFTSDWEENDSEYRRSIRSYANYLREEKLSEMACELGWVTIGKLQNDSPMMWYFEVHQTPMAAKALSFAAHGVCCDIRGELDKQGTVNHWFCKLNRRNILSPVDDFYHLTRGWINEPWARAWRNMLLLRSRQIIPLRGSGEADWEETAAVRQTQIRRWDRAPNHELIRNKKELFALHPSWAQPIHDRVMEAIMQAPPKTLDIE